MFSTFVTPALRSGPFWTSSLRLAKPSRNTTSVTGTVILLADEVEVLVRILIQQVFTGCLEPYSLGTQQ